jgi:pimeloyl-ACP methyl ester carboxylesterase
VDLTTKQWQSLCEEDPQLSVLARHADVSFVLDTGNRKVLVAVRSGEIEVSEHITFNDSWAFTVVVPAGEWESFCLPAPPPMRTTLQAMINNVEGVQIDGDRLKFAQHSLVVERVLGLVRPELKERTDTTAIYRALLDDTEIVGRYVNVDIDGQPYRTYYESAGTGPLPIILLHTAGSDSRQYKYLLVSEELKEKGTLYAVDMPWHGRTEPPAGWMDREFNLTVDFYTKAIKGFGAALGLDRPIILGCSMGGAIALYLASQHGEDFRASVAVEGGFGNRGRRNEYINHPMVNQPWFIRGWVAGLIAPTSSEQMRSEILWEYSQGGPGVYYGDGHFYSVELPDLAETLPAATCPLYVLCGEYDYSATPEMAQDAADQLGGEFILMEKMGHFPISEEPERFAGYLSTILDKVAADQLTSSSQ